MKLPHLLFITLFFFSNYALANRCDSTETAAGTEAFTNSFEAAQILAKALCNQYIDPQTDYSVDIEAKADIWKAKTLGDAKNLKLESVGIDLTEIINHIHKEIVNGEPYVTFIVARSPAYTYRTGDIKPIPYDNNACKALEQNLNCFKLLKQLAKVTDTIISSTNVKTLEKAFANLGLYSRAWDEYFTRARSQTFIELSLNTWIYKAELKKGENVPPPDWQAIFLHPNAGFEYISEATDGEQLKEVLIMEWFGFNFWNASLPWGASFISTYSDRASVDNQGYGVILHIDNNYSIAYTDRSGDSGVILTIDLLKLFEDKKTNLEKYKDNIKDYLPK